MSKKGEKIIISKKLAEDLIWWLDHADVPFNDGWLRRYVNGNREFTQMEIARDSMVDELEKALKPEDFTGVVVLSIEEACEILDYLGYLHLSGGRDSFLKGLEKCNRNLYERIEQAEKKDE